LDPVYKYRHRFGIESSHRLWDEARARTASRCVALRWLLVGLTVLLYNLWVFLKWDVVSWPRRGGRHVFHELFPFRQLLFFLTKALEELFGTVRHVATPVPPD
jgi:IS4 transposase